MLRSAGCLRATIPFVFFTVAASGLSAAPITYVLLPGSTVTPYDGATPTGPTEDMAGSFTWQLTSNYRFQYTALNFKSASTTWILDPQNTASFTVNAGNSTAYFDVVMDDTGFATSPIHAFSWTGWQPFQGPPDSPTSLNFPDMGLGPVGGGIWVGRMTIVAAQAFPGDANLDGRVDVNDLTIVLTDYGQSAANGWRSGDFNGDAQVDVNDLTVVLTNYGKSLGASAGGMAAVPEPAALALLGGAMIGLLAYAWRRWPKA
jgi:hypothetical protein